MDADLELQAAKQGVEQSIGRNVVLFQRIELLLKHIVDHCHVEADYDRLLEAKAQQTEATNGSTLGRLVTGFFRDIS